MTQSVQIQKTESTFPIPEYEAKAAALKAESQKEHPPEGTRDGLAQMVRTIRKWAIPEFPANELGQVDYMRVVFEAAADTIEAYLDKTRWRDAKTEPPTETGNYLVIRHPEDWGCSLEYNADLKGWNVYQCMIDPKDFMRDNEMFPSHWMPLPEGPKIKDQEGA